MRHAVARLADQIRPARGRMAVLLVRNVVGSVIAYLACVEASVPVLLLDARTRPDDLRRILDLYEPELVLAVDETNPGPGHEPAPLEFGLTAWWRASPGSHPRIHPDLAVLLSTSGSTGSAKLVRLTRRNLEANAESIRLALSIDGAERGMASLPLHYSYGLSVVNSHLAAGASVVLTEESVASPRFWRLLGDERCTSMPGVPYTYDLLARIGFEQIDTPSLRTLTQAGGKLAPELVLRFHSAMSARGGRLHVMYGQTEATARIACLPRGVLPARHASVGVAIPGGHLSIQHAADGAARGEIVYRGPNV
ncbi:MAG: AMP-binding protein, partial [Anaeromyxobacteraceae bacterium]